MAYARVAIVVFSFLFPGSGSTAQSPAQASQATKLRNGDVAQMVGAGLSDSIVITAIRLATKSEFDLTPAGLIALKKARVSDAIISTMQRVGALQPQGGSTSSTVATDRTSANDAKQPVKAPCGECNDGKLSREKAAAWIAAEGFPRAEAADLLVEYTTFSSRDPEPGSILDRLRVAGLVTYVNTTAGMGTRRVEAQLTAAGALYLLAGKRQVDLDGYTKAVTVRLANLGFGEVTGIIANGESTATVEYTILRREITPFGSVGYSKKEESMRNTARFTRYDDGWRLDGASAAPAARPTSMPAEPTYFEFQVQKPAVLAPGSGGPRYPDMLRTAGVQGEVLVQFVVDTTGRVELETFKVLKSAHDMFTAAVQNALPTMRFVPAEIAGKKVKQVVQWPFKFTIS